MVLFKRKGMYMQTVVKDMGIASFLLASEKVHLVKTERQDRNLMLFYFAPKKVAEELTRAYWSDTALASPRKLFASQRSLKDLIFGSLT